MNQLDKLDGIANLLQQELAEARKSWGIEPPRTATTGSDNPQDAGAAPVSQQSTIPSQNGISPADAVARVRKAMEGTLDGSEYSATAVMRAAEAEVEKIQVENNERLDAANRRIAELESQQSAAGVSGGVDSDTRGEVTGYACPIARAQTTSRDALDAILAGAIPAHSPADRLLCPTCDHLRGCRVAEFGYVAECHGYQPAATAATKGESDEPGDHRPGNGTSGGDFGHNRPDNSDIRTGDQAPSLVAQARAAWEKALRSGPYKSPARPVGIVMSVAESILEAAEKREAELEAEVTAAHAAMPNGFYGGNPLAFRVQKAYDLATKAVKTNGI